MKPNLLGWTLAAVLIVLWALATLAHGGECPARKLEPGEALDHDCRLFRIVKEGDVRLIERPLRGGWVRTEKIDCFKAVEEAGVFMYHARTVAADFYCGGAK